MLPLNNSIFPIQREYQELLGQIEEAEGEITPEMEAALAFTVGNMQNVGINIAQCIKTIDYWTELVEKEIERLEGIRKKAIKGSTTLRERLSNAMQQFDIERIASPTITVSFRRSEAVEIYSEEIIPPAFLDQPPPKVNKIRIKEAIKSGREVPGAELVQRKNLQIK